MSVSDLKINCLNYSCACQRAEVDTLLSVVQTRVQSHAWIQQYLPQCHHLVCADRASNLQWLPPSMSDPSPLCPYVFAKRDAKREHHFPLHIDLPIVPVACPLCHCACGLPIVPFCLWVSLHSLDPDCYVNF